MIIGFKVFNTRVNFVSSRQYSEITYTVSLLMLKGTSHILSFEFPAEIKILHRVAYFITQYHYISYNTFSKTEFILKNFILCFTKKDTLNLFHTPSMEILYKICYSSSIIIV